MTEYWFDSSTGEVVEDPDSIAQRLQGSDQNSFRPLLELLDAEEFPFKKGDFEVQRTKEWPKDKCIELGKWTLGVINPDDDQSRPLSENLMRRLYILGLSPSKWHLKHQFNSFAEYIAAVGSPVFRDYIHYRDWTIEDFVNYAKGISNGLSRKTKKKLYINDINQHRVAGNGPGYKLIRSRVGGLRKLNDLIGFPDVHSWEYDDYIDYGVKVAEANPDRGATPSLVEILAQRGRGPYEWTIANKFGTWRKYAEQVRFAADSIQYDRQSKMQSYRSGVESGIYPAAFGNLEDDKLARAIGLYRISEFCLRNVSQEERAAAATKIPSNFIREAMESDKSLTAGHIEMIAVTLDVFDEVWPNNGHLGYLKVGKREYAEYRAKENDQIRRYLGRKAQQQSMSVMDEAS
jgi:hypothetical protein